MKNILKLSLALSLAALTSCQGEPNSQSDTTIIGGEKSKNRSFYGALVNKSNPSAVFCGGSFLEKRIFVTAAHCVQQISGTLQVRVGFEQETKTVDQYIDVDSVVIHEEWNGSPRSGNDIAILKLVDYDSSQFEIKTIPYNKNTKVAGDSWSTPMTVVGAGQLTSVGSLMEDVLREVDVAIIPTRECKRALGGDFGNNINSKVLCAGDLSGGKDSCQGDSGGPLVTVVNGKPTLTGIVSYGRGCAQRGEPGVYTRVSTYASWIKSTISNLNKKVTVLNSDEIEKAQRQSCYDSKFLIQNGIGTEENNARVTFGYAPSFDYKEAESDIAKNVIEGFAGKESACEMEIPGQSEKVFIDLFNMGENNIRFVARNKEKVWTSDSKVFVAQIGLNCDNAGDIMSLTFGGGSGISSIEGDTYFLSGLSMPSSALEKVEPAKVCDVNGIKMNYYEVLLGGKRVQLATLESGLFGRSAQQVFELLPISSLNTGEIFFSGFYRQNANNSGSLSLSYGRTDNYDAYTWEFMCNFEYSLKDSVGRSFKPVKTAFTTATGEKVELYSARFETGEVHGDFLRGETKRFEMKTTKKLSESSLCTINNTLVDLKIR